MVESDPVDNSLPFADITGKIKQADKTAREMYARLDRFMEENAKKEKTSKSIPKQNNEKKTEKEAQQEAPELKEDIKEDEDRKLEDTVVADIASNVKQSNEQIEQIQDQGEKNTQTVLNAVEQLDKHQRTEVVTEDQKDTPQIEAKIQPEVNIKAELPKQEELLDVKIISEPIKEQKTEVQPILSDALNVPQVSMPEKQPEKEIIKVVEEKQIKNSQEEPSFFEPKISEINQQTIEPLEVLTTDFKIAENIATKIPAVDENTILNTSDRATENTIEKINIATDSDAQQLKNTIPTVVENIVKPPLEPEIEPVMPPVAEETEMPFVTATEAPKEQEIPQIVADSGNKNIPTINASDESLLSISKSLENITLALKQNQDKLVNSISNLNNTAAEILKMLPTMQSQSQQPAMIGGISQQNRRRSTDTTNMIGNFRDSLNITTRGYNRNTVFPGNNSIA